MKYIDEIFEKYKDENKSLLIKLRYDKQLLSELIEETSFLNNDDTCISERVWYYKNHLTSPEICPYCGKKKKKFRRLDIGLFSTCGDIECKKAGMSKGAKKERNWKDIQAKMRSTYKERTGYEHNMQNPDFIKSLKENGHVFGVETENAKKRRDEVFNEKYNGNIREMFVNGIIAKYGTLSNAAKSCAEKRGNTLSKNRHNEVISKLEEMGYTFISNKGNKDVQTDLYTIKCNRCGQLLTLTRYGILYHYRSNTWNFCNKCDFKEMTFRSNFEKSVGKYIDSIYKTEIWYNRYIGGIECDIIIPDKKIAIEANGLYWHSEIYKDKNFHVKKKEQVEKEGYSLIQIWEDDWNDPIKNQIIKSRLKEKLGLIENVVYARKCNLKLVSGTETKKFLEENHLQGYIHSSYNIGLYYNNELVEIATFGRCRNLISGPKNNNEIELYRLCTKKDYSVIGGLSKLISHSQDIIKWEKLITYADCDWCQFDNTGYEKIGFNKVRHTGVDYWWNIDGHRKNRMGFTKKSLVKQGYDSNKTETEIMHERGYKKIYGSGNLLFEMKKTR